MQTVIQFVFSFVCCSCCILTVVHQLIYFVEYRIYSNKRHGAYLIFRATSAALI